MELTQSFSLPYRAPQVWQSFHDIEAIVSCLPGAALLEAPDNQQLKISMTVKLGPIVAAFTGDGTMALDDSSLVGSISGSGADRKSGSRVKGQADFALSEACAADGSPVTTVRVTVQYTITGALAQFSRGGIVNDVAQRLTQAFAENLKLKLDHLKPTEEAEQKRPSPPSHSAPSPTAPLDLGNLFWASLWGRIKRIFRQ